MGAVLQLKFSKNNYEVSLTLRAEPGLRDVQGSIRTLLYGLNVAKQWRT